MTLRANNNYQHAFTELVTSFGELDTALEKSVYATTPEMAASVCTQIYGKAQTAQMALGSLPFFGDELGETASFISKVGDYSYAMTQSAASGSFNDDTRAVLESLSKTSSELSQNLQNMYADMSQGALTIYDTQAEVHELANTEKEAVNDSMLDSFKNMESEFPEVPSLIYDGPFSDDYETGSYGMLEGKTELSEDEALKKAEELSGAQGLKSGGEVNGKTKLYVFDNEKVRIYITANGGYLADMKTYADIPESKISTDDATTKAIEFLTNIGYTEMRPTYHLIQDNAVIINFAYKLGDYVCYPDLIKVRVSLADGAILDIEADGYLRNHKDRQIPEEAVSKSDAKSLIPSNLKLLSEGLAVIPSHGKNEKFCYEFICENSDGKHYIVYVGTESGKQENILILIEDENGTLTM